MLAIVAANTEAPAQAAATRIAADLSALEAFVDQAISAAAALVQSMIEGRRDSGVTVHTGQVALMRLQRAQASLVAASSDTFRVHDELAKLAKTMMVMEDPTPMSGLLAYDEPQPVAA